MPPEQPHPPPSLHPQPPPTPPTGANSPPGLLMNAENTESVLAEWLPQSGHGASSSMPDMERSFSNRFRQVAQTYSYTGIFSPRGFLPRFYPAAFGESIATELLCRSPQWAGPQPQVGRGVRHHKGQPVDWLLNAARWSSIVRRAMTCARYTAMMCPRTTAPTLRNHANLALTREMCRVGRRRITLIAQSAFPSVPLRTGRAAFTASGSPVSL